MRLCTERAHCIPGDTDQNTYVMEGRGWGAQETAIRLFNKKALHQRKIKQHIEDDDGKKP